MEFYEITAFDMEDNGEILWSLEGVEIAEPAKTDVYKIRVSCSYSFSDKAALRALKTVLNTVSPQILELDGFEELDLAETQTSGFTKRAFAIILTNAAKKWANVHTLSLVDCNFMGSYDRAAMEVLFRSLPARVRTLKVTGAVSLMIDRFDPSTGDNGLRVPLNFDVIDMSDISTDCIDEMSALTESYVSRCMLREGRHAERTTRPKIIYPEGLAHIPVVDLLQDDDEVILMNRLVRQPHPHLKSNGPLSIFQSALVFATQDLPLSRAVDDTPLTWLVDPSKTDVVNPPEHIAQIRARFVAYCDWFKIQRTVAAVLSAAQRDDNRAAAAAAATPRVDAVTTTIIGAVSVVQQWMLDE
jgi:hypothetical protein